MHKAITIITLCTLILGTALNAGAVSLKSSLTFTGENQGESFGPISRSEALGRQSSIYKLTSFHTPYLPNNNPPAVLIGTDGYLYFTFPPQSINAKSPDHNFLTVKINGKTVRLEKLSSANGNFIYRAALAEIPNSEGSADFGEATHFKIQSAGNEGGPIPKTPDYPWLGHGTATLMEFDLEKVPVVEDNRYADPGDWKSVQEGKEFTFPLTQNYPMPVGPGNYGYGHGEKEGKIVVPIENQNTPSQSATEEQEVGKKVIIVHRITGREKIWSTKNSIPEGWMIKTNQLAPTSPGVAPIVVPPETPENEATKSPIINGVQMTGKIVWLKNRLPLNKMGNLQIETDTGTYSISDKTVENIKEKLKKNTGKTIQIEGAFELPPGIWVQKEKEDTLKITKKINTAPLFSKKKIIVTKILPFSETLNGKISVVGNEPFVEAVLETTNNSRYSLKGRLATELKQLSNFNVTITGYESDKGSSSLYADSGFEVTSYDVIPSQSLSGQWTSVCDIRVENFETAFPRSKISDSNQKIMILTTKQGQSYIVDENSKNQIMNRIQDLSQYKIIVHFTPQMNAYQNLSEISQGLNKLPIPALPIHVDGYKLIKKAIPFPIPPKRQDYYYAK